MLQNTVNNSADASHSVDEEPPEEAVDEELETVSEEDQSDSELEPVEKNEEDFPMEDGHAADLRSFENSSIINAISDYDSEEVELIWR